MADANILVENSDLPGVRQAGQFNTKLPMSLQGSAANLSVGGNLTVTGTLSAGSETTTSQVITATSANAFAVGPAGTTNPSFNVDTSGGVTDVTGLNVNSNAAASGLALSVLSSGTNESLYIDAKGSGNIFLNATATGGIQANRFTTISVSNGDAFDVGPNGQTNPTLKVVTNIASAATGLSITSAAAAGGLALAVISSGTDENVTIAAKGAGTVTFNPAVVAAAGGKISSGIQYGSIAVGLYTGTGAPSFSAMNGSIYTDSNATTTTTRIYVNKSGAGTAGTTWTALTTAA